MTITTKFISGCCSGSALDGIDVCSDASESNSQYVLRAEALPDKQSVTERILARLPDDSGGAPDAFSASAAEAVSTNASASEATKRSALTSARGELARLDAEVAAETEQRRRVSPPLRV